MSADPRAASTSPEDSVGFTVDAVLVVALLVPLLLLHRHALWSWLEHPVVRYLGVISYPLYLWQVWGLGVGKWLPVPLAGQFSRRLRLDDPCATSCAHRAVAGAVGGD